MTDWENTAGKMAHKRAFAGIDIGATNIKYGLVDPDGKVIFREQRPTVAEKGPEALMHLVTNIAERLLLSAAEDEYDVRWLGVGTPGAVDVRTGKVIGPSPNIAGWQGTEIGRTLTDRLNLPVWVDNDVNAMALAEARFGAAVGFKSVVCVAIGTGVGGGLILNGQLWRGAGYSAYIFWRKRILLHRTVGNILIAVGAILPAFGGLHIRFAETPELFYISELVGVIIIFLGFLRSREIFGLYRFPLIHGFKKVAPE